MHQLNLERAHSSSNARPPKIPSTRCAALQGSFRQLYFHAHTHHGSIQLTPLGTCPWIFPKSLIIRKSTAWWQFPHSHCGSESWQVQVLSSTRDQTLWDFLWFSKKTPFHIDQKSSPPRCTFRGAWWKKYRDQLFCQAESFMSLRYFQKVKLRSLMDFLNTSLHKTVMSSSVTQHWWRSRTSRFFKLAKWAAESLKPPPISLLHEMSNFLSSARCCKAVPETEKATSWSLAATGAQVRALASIYFNVKLCPRYCRQSSWAKLQCIITADTQ